MRWPCGATEAADVTLVLGAGLDAPINSIIDQLGQGVSDLSLEVGAGGAG
jgi:hypothetical protein